MLNVGHFWQLYLIFWTCNGCDATTNTMKITLYIIFYLCKKIEDELIKEIPDIKLLSVLKTQIGDKFTHLEACQMDITELILKGKDVQNVHVDDFLCAENYRKKYYKLYSKTE